MQKRPHYLSNKNKTLPQRGQALVEFLIAASLLLVPLFFMISYVAKYHDMQAATIQAARYAAWERTVYFGSGDWASGTATKSDATIQNEIRSRFLSARGTGFANPTTENNSIWSDHAGEPILGTWSQASPSAQTPGTGDYVLVKVKDIIATIGKVLGADGFKLDMKSLYSAEVSVTPANSNAISRIFAGADGSFSLLTLTEKNVMVANGWSANGKTFVEKQTGSLALTNVFDRDPLSTVLDYAKTGLKVFYPEFGGLDLGKMQVDNVPGDRVSGGIAPVPAPTRVSSTSQAGTQGGAQQGIYQNQGNAFADKMRAFQGRLDGIQSTINSCATQKQTEMWGNFYGTKTGTRDATCRVKVGSHIEGWTCSDSWRPAWCYWVDDYEDRACQESYAYEYKKKLNSDEYPGNSWTPKFDADYSCHGGLNQTISQLKNDFNNDPVITQAQQACGSNPSDDCNAINSKITETNAKIAEKQTNRNALDTPFTNCNCAAGTGTICRAWPDLKRMGLPYDPVCR
jgi:hypothetical protein